MDRRTFLRSSLASGLVIGSGGYLADRAVAAPAHPGPGPYGPLGGPDANGVLLPEGFTARVVAVAGRPVGEIHGNSALSHVWHTFPDGGACFPTADGGWVHASNSEVADGQGGAGAITFAADGTITDAYSILTGTSRNCAGGPTPWGTWLSCEEHPGGQVWECDPFEPGEGTVRPALGTFAHEAVAVDPEGQQLYMTEDAGRSAFYRFTPTSYPDLSEGLLEVAVCEGPVGGDTRWVAVPDPSGAAGRTAEQVPGANIFDGGEGCWHDEGFIYHTTKNDNRVWVYEIAAARMFVLYDVKDNPDSPLVPVREGGTVVDNITVSPSGDVLVAEDGGNLEICVIAADTREIAPIMRLEGPHHAGSEITGPAFSPDGSRLYFSSQRSTSVATGAATEVEAGTGLGVTFEVTGPFRSDRVGIAAIGSSETPEPIPSAGTPTELLDPEHTGRTIPVVGIATIGAGAGVLALTGLVRLRRHGRQQHPAPGGHD